ncbi:MAG: RAMP superfamily CRISPR-associated protein [Candidatus Odinarchaeum yellowstonii]|uniref:RAMP superfamily CRISPR-associated protein n=1 Tax=Odinarchaeota yellowstonii (strain LCB_4) TaxID=1841599 RepID=A0AAF0D239_ODILC|nr:MAG: RAMP superfamily CRISPR-associated protein [Candidatus Odinarchaeum yellowstonii]
MNQLLVNIRFKLKSSLHSSGDRKIFGVDKAVYLDPVDSTPAVPATSFKGLLRRSLESILKSRKIKVCDSPRPDSMCASRDEACIICRFFGSPIIKSPLIFSDVKIKSPLIENRTGIAINRSTRTVLEDHLFTTQIVSGKELETSVKGFFEKFDDCLVAAALLYLGVKLIFGIGASASRGLGWIEFKEFNAKVDGKLLDEKQVLNKIAEVLSL